MTIPSSRSPFDDATGKQLIEFLKQQGVIASVSATFVANGATAVVVAAPSITASSSVGISLNTVGGTVGALPRLVTLTPGTGFTVNATAGDTSIYNYSITN